MGTHANLSWLHYSIHIGILSNTWGAWLFHIIINIYKYHGYNIQLVNSMINHENHIICHACYLNFMKLVINHGLKPQLYHNHEYNLIQAWKSQIRKLIFLNGVLGLHGWKEPMNEHLTYLNWRILEGSWWFSWTWAWIFEGRVCSWDRMVLNWENLNKIWPNMILGALILCFSRIGAMGKGQTVPGKLKI